MSCTPQSDPNLLTQHFLFTAALLEFQLVYHVSITGRCAIIMKKALSKQ